MTMIDDIECRMGQATNDDGLTIEENCKSLRTTALVTKEWLLWPEDDYIGGLRNFGRR